MTVERAPRTRRNFLTLIAGAAAGVVGSTLAGAQRALAAGSDGEAIVVAGQYTDARGETRLANNTDNTTTLKAINNQNGIGFEAYSRGSSAIEAQSYDGPGIFASAVAPGARAIHAKTDATTGATFTILSETRSPAGAAVLGNNYATSGNAQGIQGTTDSAKGFAAVGWAPVKGTGAIGVSGRPFPAIPANTGVYGHAVDGRGGAFAGTRSQVRLVPSTATTHPSSGLRGDLFVDRSGRLWFCKGGSSWKQLA